jgi:hypothetical protein
MGPLSRNPKMPDKPTWYGRLPTVIEQLQALPYPWVDRATLENLLGVRRRRAQQILAPCLTHTIGASGVADRAQLIAHLEQLAAGDTARYEQQRRRKLAETLTALHQRAVQSPQVWVEAPAEVVNATIAGLPEGVVLGEGEIRVRFANPQQALERLLALAMAIGNDYEAFQRVTAPPGNDR